MNEADALVADEYEPFKQEIFRTVAGKLAASGVRMTDDDLGPHYNEAWHALYMKLASGEDIENRKGFLVTVTHRRALSEHRAHHPGRFAPENELDYVGVEADLDAQMDAEIQLKQITEGFRDKLSEREFEAATLCHLHGYSRPEAAKVIGVEPKRMEKIMDGASSQISSVIGRVKAGTHCQEMDSVVRAFAVGLLSPEGERYQLAESHLEFCAPCRRQVLVARGLAAAAPPFPAFIALVAGASSATGIVGSGASATGPGAKSSVAHSGKPTPGKTSTARKSAVAAAAVVAVASVAVAGALALGVGGGDSSSDGGGGGGGGAGSGAGGSGSGSVGASALDSATAKQKGKSPDGKSKDSDQKKNDQTTKDGSAEDQPGNPVTEEPPVASVVPVIPDPPSDPVPAPVSPDQSQPDPPKPDKPQPTKPDPEKPRPPRPDTGKPGTGGQEKPITDAGEEFEIR